MTERERLVLRYAGEQFGLPMSVVAQVLAAHGGGKLGPGPAEAVARRVAARLEAGTLARRVRVYGAGVWLVPTTRGLRLVHLEYARWEPAGWKLEHHATVARLRLHLERAEPSARWESERSIRARLRDTEHARRADGALWWPDGTATAVECELHLKGRRRGKSVPASMRDPYAEVVRDTEQTFVEVWWFTPAPLADRLGRRLREAGGADRHHVYQLPPEVRP